jgi:hypothetical protein
LGVAHYYRVISWRPVAEPVNFKLTPSRNLPLAVNLNLNF